MQHSAWLLLLQTFWAKSIEDRAKVDLKLHFMKKTLNEVVSIFRYFPVALSNCILPLEHKRRTMCCAKRMLDRTFVWVIAASSTEVRRVQLQYSGHSFVALVTACAHLGCGWGDWGVPLYYPLMSMVYMFLCTGVLANI